MPYLKEQGVELFHLLIATHPHLDHIGGLIDVLKTYPVEKIYDSGYPHTSQTFYDYLLLIDELEIPYYTPRRGEVIEIGDLSLDVLSPCDDSPYRGLNNVSIVVRLSYGDISFLFTGDIEEEIEEELIHLSMEESTVLKVAHHGSNTSTTEEFLKVVRPQVAIISCGENNPFEHPHQEVLDRLESFGRQVEDRDSDHEGILIFRTDIDGHIIFSTDGETYEIKTMEEFDQEMLLININTASLEELQSLHGVGIVIAERIIEYRELHGPFLRIEELKEVQGIGEVRFEQLKDQIKVRDEWDWEKYSIDQLWID